MSDVQRAADKRGECFKRALPSRCTWTSRKDGIWERAKHIWVDQRRGGREQTRAIMAGEVTGREETDREQSGGECCDLRRRKAGKRVCNAERGSGKSERSKIVHVKKCEVKWSGYRGKERINHRMRKDCCSEPFVFSIKPHWMHFFSCRHTALSC